MKGVAVLMNNNHIVSQNSVVLLRKLGLVSSFFKRIFLFFVFSAMRDIGVSICLSIYCVL